MILFKVGQSTDPAPADEWSYLALIIEPDKLVLNKWEDDAPVTIAEYAFDQDGPDPEQEAGVWYDIHLVFSGVNNEHVVVNHGKRGLPLTQKIDRVAHVLPHMHALAR